MVGLEGTWKEAAQARTGKRLEGLMKNFQNLGGCSTQAPPECRSEAIHLEPAYSVLSSGKNSV
jgi:hypothetical protein